ncbi:ANTH domain-containing protein [Scheffersomyces xylosifermentans]|uniref:ANTH domain-containing protein n=1 Tax=Scheffersomyces xylosifermentans TaxID=1304137 RepID=UPI00315DC10E
MTTYEKIVKGATKIKVAAPKPKYIEPILMATSTDLSLETDNFSTVMKTLQSRLHDSAWSVVYKSLIVIHIMIREGDRDVTLKYLATRAPHMLNLSTSNISKNNNFNTDVRFIVKYAKYLQTRVKQFEATGIDYVRDERSNNSTSQQGGRLRSLSVEKGLLRESESVQKQIDSLLKNNFMENEINNDIVLTAFRLLVNDLLALFQELNEGVINLLEHYFEMSKVDAERALKIYKKFVDQTKYVIDYLRVAKHLEYATRLHVPTIKHAPTALTSSLEEYLDDPNFEMNRRQYMNEKGNKTENTSQVNTNGNSSKSAQPEQPELNRNNTLIVQQSTFNPWGAIQQQPVVVVAVDPNQQADAIQQQQVQQIQQFSPSPFQAAFTGAGFGGYGQQVAQPQAQAQLPQNTGNPFLQGFTTSPNPLEQQQLQQQQLQQQQLQQLQQQQQQQQLSIQPFSQRAETNPFATMRTASTGSALEPNHTSSNPFANTRFASNTTTTALSFNNSPTANGATSIPLTSTGSNPFKISQTSTDLFNKASSQQNAQPQQIKPQPTAGGLELLPTIPVFPETQQETQRQYYLNNARTVIEQQTGSQPQYQQQFLSQQQTQQQPVQNQFQQQPFQQQFTQQFSPQFTQFPQQAQQQTNNAYQGPNLI